MRDTRIWICPKLCGCELKITAEWAGKAVTEGGRKISYQHPRPQTIKSLEIENVCSDHESFKTEQIDNEILFRYLCAGPTCYHPKPDGEPKHAPKPFNELTEAEQLYINLTRYIGTQWVVPTCKCKVAITADSLSGEHIKLEHPIHTGRCKFHTNDTGHVKAEGEYRTHKSVLETLMLESDLTEKFVDNPFKPGSLLVVNEDIRGLLQGFGLAESDFKIRLKPEIKVEFDEERKIKIKGVEESKRNVMRNKLKDYKDVSVED